MNLPPVCRRVLLLVGLAALAAVRLAAQNILFTDIDGKFLPVRKAHNNEPLVQKDGKLVVGDGRKYVLQKAEEYLPVFVSVRDQQATSRHLTINGTGNLNQEFDFSVKLESPFDVEDVFIVLELNGSDAGKMLFLQEVGNLEARRIKDVAVRIPVTETPGAGHYTFHLFSRGFEVLHSDIPPLARDRAIDRMTAKRIKGVQEAMPKLFVGPGPEYPRARLKARATGRAIISIRIGANGQVYDPTIKEATDPAFGESALVAVRLWRFLPLVEKGRPVESKVDVPFDFTPPEKGA